ncbi:MAG: hypothetical protein ACF788_02690 [Novipirellula sp. JB048]
MYKLCLAALIMFAAPTTVATAGGGGSKHKSKIVVKNGHHQCPAFVIVDVNEDALRRVQTLQQFKRLGGVIIEESESWTFKNLKNGKHRVYYAIPCGGNLPSEGDFEVAEVKTHGGSTQHLTIGNNNH